MKFVIPKLGAPWGKFLLSFSLSLLFVCTSQIWALGLGRGDSPEVHAQSQPGVETQEQQTMTSLTQGATKTVLENGLTVLTKEVNTAPVVSVQIWYRVGTRNETPGINGISHQLEHLLFKGTTKRPIQFGRLFSALGSASNAFTSYDETAYFGTVGKNKLNALLVLEADRMRNALINSEQLASEKRVVISELQGYENNPGYRLRRAVMKAAFPNRPYGLPVGGTKADVENFTVAQVQNYYRTYYSPNNATLAIVGNFSTAEVLKTVQQSFGTIPKASIPAAPEKIAEAAVASEPIILRQPGSAKLLQSVYPLPDINHPDVPAIDVMDAILTGGRSSRFYQALVETGLVSDVSAYAAEMIEPGWYTIAATAAPGQDLTKVDQVLQRSLLALQNQAVTPAELERAKTQLKASFILSNRDVDSQASQLAYNHTVSGDYQFSDRYLAAVAQVTAADVQRVAKTYLDPAKRTVGYFEPTQANEPSGSEAAAQSQQTSENFSSGEPVDPAEVAKYLPPVPAEAATKGQPLPEKITLKNGLTVLLLPDPSTPTVTLSGQVRAGSSFDIAAQAGTASLTAENLSSGTKTKDALTLAQALENRGISLGFDAYREGVDIEGNALAGDLPVLLQSLADVLQNATFPKQELELSRQRALTALQVELDDPGRLGRRVFQQAVYPQNHPFHVFPSQQTLKDISRQQIARFYQQHYRPDTTVLALVGDFEPAKVRSLLDQNFGNWKANGKAPSLEFPKVSLPKGIERLTPALPGKSQSVSYLGYEGITRSDPRFYAAQVANQILGGDTLSSRLGTEIRDRQGLTYGIYSYFAAGRHAGPFVIQLQTAPEDARKAIASTLKLLEQFRQQGITATELSNAKRTITDSYPVELASPDTLTSTILNNEVYGLSREELRQFPQQIEAVTQEQVQQVLKQLIHPNNLVVVTAGPPVAPSAGKSPSQSSQ